MLKRIAEGACMCMYACVCSKWRCASEGVAVCVLALYMYALCVIYFLDARKQGEGEKFSKMVEALMNQLNGKLTCRFTVIAQS